MKTRKTLFEVYLTLLLLALGMYVESCKSSSSSSSPPSGFPNPTGTPAPSLGANDFYVTVNNPPSTNYFLHVDKNWALPCDIAQGATHQDLFCVLEGEEMDLYEQGLVLQYNVPAAMCAYTRLNPYFYFDYKPGWGPTAVTVNVNAAGSFSLGAVTGGINASVTGLNNGTPICSTDHTNDPIPGPNCCEGNYTLTSTNTSTGQTNTSIVSWGGKVSNCLKGPSMDTQTIDKSGYPEATDTYLNGTTLNGTYTIASPLSKQLVTNVYIANYFTVANYVYLNAPVPMNPFHDTYPNSNAGLPGVAPLETYGNSQPYYEWDCFDHAEDVINRIRILVRAWSTDSEFAKSSDSANFTKDGLEQYFPDQPALDRESWPVSAIDGQGFGNNYPAGAD